uniref:G-protein coupled receptors family 3 profile domain-containing protein n=1 Tax=Xenopus tropicalis TaxID=8364 RepID=A0A1B8Y3J3_XENTR
MRSPNRLPHNHKCIFLKLLATRYRPPIGGDIGPNQENIKLLVDFQFAVEQTNKDPARLPNLTLGYHIYDSCGDPRKAVRSVLQILSGTREPISYGATDPELSDRITFPYLFRTVQSDEFNYFVMSKLLSHFGWNWVGIITSDDISGEREHQILAKYLSREGVCIEFTLRIDMYNCKLIQLQKEKRIIRESSTSVIILCGQVSILLIVRADHDLHDPNDPHVFHDKTLILSPSWGSMESILYYAPEIFNCSLALVPGYHYDLDTPEMRSFLENSHPSNHPEDKLLIDIWMIYLNCLSKDKHKNDLYKYIYFYNPNLYNCTGQERITDLRYFRGKYNSPRVHLAVDMMSRALHDMNMELNEKSKEKREMNINRQKIPRAQCSDSCLPGQRKMPIPGAQSCCYGCAPCANGEISNTTDSVSCIRCSDMEWPNEMKNQCIGRKEEFLSYTKDLISVFISLVSAFFILTTQLILGVFIKYRDTPIVRANNRSLSFLLLVSIKLSFLSVFLFLGRPVDITCMLRIITFGITFSIAVSSLLAKTIMVCVAFKATKPGSSWRKWLGVKLSNSVVLFCSSIQIIICMTWLAISPPFQELDIHTSPGTIIIQCNEGSAIGFYSVIGYMGLLAAVSFVLAFLARSLPDSFNEAKYITFSMLLFCSVWITMIPAYLSTKGKNTVCVEIFAILTSSAGLLACIFLPKCYIILLRPEMNTKSCLFTN